jgi:hypothetical protein
MWVSISSIATVTTKSNSDSLSQPTPDGSKTDASTDLLDISNQVETPLMNGTSLGQWHGDFQDTEYSARQTTTSVPSEPAFPKVADVLKVIAKANESQGEFNLLETFFGPKSTSSGK